MIRVVCLLIGYVFGLFQTAFFLGKAKGIDIRQHGSGNSGTTNTLRVLGTKAGLIVFLGDCLKAIIAVCLVRFLFSETYPDLEYLLCLYTGAGVILGHNYPFYMNFKGGKGIATTLGVFMVADPILSLILFGIMIITLFFIKIGSVVSLLYITIIGIVQLFKDYIDGNWIAIVCLLLILILDIFAHRSNLLRLVENKENPADLQEALKKDIEKINDKREKKLEKTAIKTKKIDKKYENKITKRSEKIQKRIDKISKRA